MNRIEKNMAPRAMTLMSVFFSMPSNLSLDDEPSDATDALAAAGERVGTATGRASSGLRGAGTPSLSPPRWRGLRALACFGVRERRRLEGGEMGDQGQTRQRSIAPLLFLDAFLLLFLSPLTWTPRLAAGARRGTVEAVVARVGGRTAVAASAGRTAKAIERNLKKEKKSNRRLSPFLLFRWRNFVSKQSLSPLASLSTPSELVSLPSAPRAFS